MAVNIELNHELRSVHAVSKTMATYECSCGTTGGATMAPHLASPWALFYRAFKNHELHATRAYIKEIRKLEKVS